MMLYIICLAPLYKPQNNNTVLQMLKLVLGSHPSQGLFKKTVKVWSSSVSVSMRRKKRNPQLRGETSTRLMRAAVSLQSAPLVSQHVKHSQHDTKYIKVQDCYHRFTEHPCTRDLHSAFFFPWQGVSTALEAKLCKGILSLSPHSDTGGLFSMLPLFYTKQ